MEELTEVQSNNFIFVNKGPLALLVVIIIVPI